MERGSPTASLHIYIYIQFMTDGNCWVMGDGGRWKKEEGAGGDTAGSSWEMMGVVRCSSSW